MENKFIHIVSLDVPFPPDYGGMMDVYYRILALKELGYSVILHAFTYGREKPKELEAVCHQVHYYQRKRSVLALLSKRPFIVETRKSHELLNRLQQDSYPILIEGLHGCWLLEQDLGNRKVIVRTHNVEHDYYSQLAIKSKGLKRLFFQVESRKLRKYEHILSHSTALWCIQKNDLSHFEKLQPNCYLLPASMPLKSIDYQVELGNYFLYHGNLSVAEVSESAFWLLENVVPFLRKNSLKIAGKNPSQALVDRCKVAGVEIIANPNSEKMDLLIQNARLHVLPTMQDTGLKLKLLMALQSMGPTIVNSKQLAGNDLKEFCIVAETPSEFIEAINAEMSKSIDLAQRKLAIEKFQNRYNTQTLIADVMNQMSL